MQFKDTTGVHILFVTWHLNHVLALVIDGSYVMQLQNVKAVFDAAIKVVLQPPKQKKKKKKSHRACSIL